MAKDLLLPKGFSLRLSHVLYDRKYSTFYEYKLEDYGIDVICEEVDRLHISGMMVVINPEMYNIAQEKDILISFDLN
ncbi:hypothetical protein [Tuanshanicoccus yangjingiae]|uniref:hypothetical protein n=1 Tax=Aerococcaceae bacterium zg-252 TaxID=2796928 RepID=UPI00406422B3